MESSAHVPSYTVIEAGIFEKTDRFGKVTKCKLFDVKFPKGHSVRITEADMKRHGLHLPPTVIELDGEAELQKPTRKTKEN